MHATKDSELYQRDEATEGKLKVETVSFHKKIKSSSNKMLQDFLIRSQNSQESRHS